MNMRLIRTGLSWLGVLGIGITSWLSVKCSRKADEKTDAKDKIAAYGPAIASGVVSAACVLGSNHLGNREIAALAAGAAYLSKKRDQLMLPDGQKKTEDQKGVDIAPWEGPSVEWTGNGTQLCFEAYSGRLFYSSEKAVREAQDALNEMFVTGERVSLNTYYALLGIAETTFGDQYGWNAASDYYSGPIEFINGEDAHTHMLICDIYTLPMECWKEE